MTDPVTLRDLVVRAMQRLNVTSGRALAKKLDDRISHSTVNAILHGTYTNEPKPETLRALADAANVEESVAFAAAGVPVREPFQLPDSASRLHGDQREAVLAVVRAFVRANSEGESDDSESTSQTVRQLRPGQAAMQEAASAAQARRKAPSQRKPSGGRKPNPGAT